MDLQTFLALPIEEVATIVQASGAKVCVFPINGTRRWFLLEYGDKVKEDPVGAYLDISISGHIKIYKLFYEYGLNTLLAPIFGSELLNRGDEYVKMASKGMARLATHSEFLSFYKDYNVRVSFYGDFVNRLTDTPYAYLIDLFDQIRQDTASNTGCRLFYGVFAGESSESVAELAVKHYLATGKFPTRHDLIELYYGEYIDKADIFIGFEKFNVFDYPLLGWGEESLYFTVAPSLYMTEHQLRNILFDYLYLRPVHDPIYEEMALEDIENMRTYYQNNREAVFGVGEMRNGIWYANTKIQE